MRFLVQRVQRASVSVANETIGEIDKGYLILMGVAPNDTKEQADLLMKKALSMRIFEDEGGKTNLSLSQVGGSILLVSQFTLYGSLRHGNRPSFMGFAAAPDIAEPLYDYVTEGLRKSGVHVETGSFGADMQVSLLNDGPFTVLLDSDELTA